MISHISFTVLSHRPPIGIGSPFFYWFASQRNPRKSVLVVRYLPGRPHFALPTAGFSWWLFSELRNAPNSLQSTPSPDSALQSMLKLRVFILKRLRKLRGFKKGVTLLHLYLKKNQVVLYRMRPKSQDKKQGGWGSAVTQVEDSVAGYRGRKQRGTAQTGDLVCLGAELIVQLIDSMWDWKGICEVFSLNNKMNLFIWQCHLLKTVGGPQSLIKTLLSAERLSSWAPDTARTSGYSWSLQLALNKARGPSLAHAGQCMARISWNPSCKMSRPLSHKWHIMPIGAKNLLSSYTQRQVHLAPQDD